MEGQQSIEKHEKDSTTESRQSLKSGKFPPQFSSKSIHPEEKSAKFGLKSAEFEDATRREYLSLAKHRTKYDPFASLEKHREKDSTTDSRESLKSGKFLPPFPSKLFHPEEKSAKLGLKSTEFDVTYRKSRLPTERLTKDDPFLGSYFSLTDSDEEYSEALLPSSSGASTSSSSKVAIKLSAEHLVSRRELREEYLMDTIMESFHRSSGCKTFVELFVDLTELDLELGKQVARQDTRVSRHYAGFRSMSYLRSIRPCSLMVTQTDGNCSVSNRTITTFSETFCDLNVFFQLKSVDVSNCTIPTQVSLLPRLLSAHGMKWSSMKVICVFSNDFLHLKEEEVIFLLNLTKPLVVKGDVSIEQFQELINQMFSFCNMKNTVTHALIKACADVNIPVTDKDGKTALFYAANNEKVTHALIEAGADVNITDKDGKTALFYAVDSEKVTHALIEAGADVNITDQYGKTALFFAAYNEKVTHALIKAGADVNITDQYGKTALFHAANNEKVTQALIEAGADVNKIDKDGKTALFYAVDNEKVTHALIEAGADVNKIDEDGKTALFYVKWNEKVTHALIEAGADVNITDKDGKTVLLCDFDSSSTVYGKKCKILLESGSSLCETTKEQESVFHLALNLFQNVISSSRDKKPRQYILLKIMEAFEIFSQSSESKVAVNKRDMHLNSPLHLWASLVLASPLQYCEYVFDDYSFEYMLKCILDVLVRCGIKLNYSNEQEQTPLNVCRTWTAVKLLLDAGAKPDVTDSSGCTPLLVAAMKNTSLKSGCLYPDVIQDPYEFWKNVLIRKLDPWTADEDGNSVLRILVKEGAESLAKALIEVACELKCLQSHAIALPLLIAICKDKSSDKEWKVDLVQTLLRYRNSLAQESLSDKDTALHFCCRNMLELPEESVKTSVHWKIAQHLILCGANVDTAGKEGKSSLDIAESCPVLKELILMPLKINIEEVPPLIDAWKPVSKRHRDQLEKVSRGFNCQQIETVHYFKEALDNGMFGLVFVGINTQDGKEVAVKRIEKTRADKENIKTEIEDLKLDICCDKVIQCLLGTYDKDFLYVILELMEGNLDDLLSDDSSFNIIPETKLCRDMCTGLDYLHNQNMIHRSIKPSNILYQVLHSGINLKLAFFGLRSQMCKEQCISSDFTDTYESLTKDRCWMAPEVLQMQSHSQSSDVFSCGLL